MLVAVDAELKFVKAGNHGFDFDKQYWEAEENMRAIGVMTGECAAENSVAHLEEGTYRLESRDGAGVTIYASPYSPEIQGWAFGYSCGDVRSMSRRRRLRDFNRLQGVRY